MKTKSILDRLKPVSSPSAQFPELLSDQNEVVQLYNTISTWCTSSMEESEPVRAIVMLQLLYGLRVSEVLRIKPSDISIDGTIKIKLSKSNSYTFVHAANFFDFWVNRVRNSGYDFSYINRFYLYRLYRRKGFYLLKAGNINDSVTHSLRQLRAFIIESQFTTKESVQVALNHKSIKSSNYYGINRQKADKK